MYREILFILFIGLAFNSCTIDNESEIDESETTMSIAGNYQGERISKRWIDTIDFFQFDTSVALIEVKPSSNKNNQVQIIIDKGDPMAFIVNEETTELTPVDRYRSPKITIIGDRLHYYWSHSEIPNTVEIIAYRTD